jgi:hypothetical protein
LPDGATLKSIAGISLRDDALLANVKLTPAKNIVTAGE